MSIYQFSSGQVADLSNEIMKLRLSHMLWLISFNKDIIYKRLKLSPVIKHDTCEFGLWYYKNYKQLSDYNRDYIELGQLHEKLHEIAINIINHYQLTQTVKEDDYDKLNRIEIKFMAVLDNFHASINSFKYSVDALTGLPNKGLIASILHKEYAKLKRLKVSNCLAFVDIDDFKGVNDTFGHIVGDQVLKFVAGNLVSSLRKYDIIGRYGGDEFLIFLPDTDIVKAKKILERTRKKIQALVYKLNADTRISLTCSIGVAKFVQLDKCYDNINNADKALYQAKQLGKNKVVISA